MFFDDYKVENNGLYILWEGDSEYDYEGAIKWHGENMLLRWGEEGDDWYFLCHNNQGVSKDRLYNSDLNHTI